MPSASNTKPPLYLRSDELKDRIVAKYPEPSWVVLDEVRDGTGYGSSRSADAMAFGVWPSRGLQIVGFEIKINRSDWIREIKDPEKAESIAQFCDQWWLVTCDGVAKLEEIPAGWGWYTADARGLKMMKPAADLAPKEIGRSFLMSIVRNISRCYVPQSKIKELVAADLETAVKGRRDDNKYRLEALERMEKHVKRFQEASGIDLLSEYNFPPRETGAVVKAVLGWRLKHDIQNIEHAVKKIQEVLKAISEFPPFLTTKGDPNAMTD